MYPTSPIKAPVDGTRDHGIHRHHFLRTPVNEGEESFQ